MIIETLEEIREKYNFWNEKERPYYEALSEAIRVLKAQKDKVHYARIVRCAECVYWEKDTIPIGKRNYSMEWHYCPMIDKDTRSDCFCADGERS